LSPVDSGISSADSNSAARGSSWRPALNDRVSPDEQPGSNTGRRQVKMRSFSSANDPQALEDFLYELVCEVKQPEQTDLLVEVLMKIQRPIEKVRDDRWAVTPIDRARIHK
jgi:hypothetical protein